MYCFNIFLFLIDCNVCIINVITVGWTHSNGTLWWEWTGSYNQGKEWTGSYNTNTKKS